MRPPRDVTPCIASCRGQSSLEYVVVLALLATVLIWADGSALQQLHQALQDRYQRYTWALSQP